MNTTFMLFSFSYNLKNILDRSDIVLARDQMSRKSVQKLFFILSHSSLDDECPIQNQINFY